jgi:hypothetical protein
MSTSYFMVDWTVVFGMPLALFPTKLGLKNISGRRNRSLLTIRCQIRHWRNSSKILSADAVVDDVDACEVRSVADVLPAASGIWSSAVLGNASSKRNMICAPVNVDVSAAAAAGTAADVVVAGGVSAGSTGSFSGLLVSSRPEGV